MGQCICCDVEPQVQIPKLDPQSRHINQQVKQQNLNRQAKQPKERQMIERKAQLQQQDRNLTGQTQQLNDEISMLDMRMQQHNKQRNDRTKEKYELMAQNEAKKRKMQEYQRQIINLRKQIEKVTSETQSNNLYQVRPAAASPTAGRNTAELEASIVRLQQLIADEKRQRDSLHATIQNISTQIEKVQSEINTIRNRIEQLKLEQSQINSQIATLRQNIQNMQSELSQAKQTRRLNAQQIEMIKREIADFEEQTRLLKNRPEQNIKKPVIINPKRFLQFFAGEILQDEEYYKEFLTEVLQNRLKNRIVSTKLIYRYDTLNKVNFHKYIDGKENIVVLVKLTNGYILGAWSEGSFQPRMVSSKDGLIFTLTNSKFFQPLERNRRAIAYDDYFLIFGNSQLRLKSQDNKVFSNFAISNGYFNTRGEKVDILLGSGGIRQTEMQNLQVFQLVLQ